MLRIESITAELREFQDVTKERLKQVRELDYCYCRFNIYYIGNNCSRFINEVTMRLDESPPRYSL